MKTENKLENRIHTVQEACEALMALEVNPGTERIPVEEACKRILAEDVTAQIAVPSFEKSAFDGYAVRREDIEEASPENRITLKVLETIAAGSVGRYSVTPGTASRIMTGAAIPDGADAVVKYEETEFSETEVTFSQPAKAPNIVAIGEDVKKGTCLSKQGKVISAADIAMMAGQGMEQVTVYKKPEIAVISTGSELLTPGQELVKGKIYNTNPYLLSGYMVANGMKPQKYGIVKDDIDALKSCVEEALAQSDMVITTGGVSVGDFDYIPRVMEQIGARILFHRLAFKPGGAMLAAVKDGKVILGLSGNPGAAVVGMLRVGWPYMKKLCGMSEFCFAEAEAFLKDPYMRKSPGTRILRGKAQIIEGKLFFQLIDNQRNGAVSSMADCNLLAEIPAGSSELQAGTKVKVYFI